MPDYDATGPRENGLGLGPCDKEPTVRLPVIGPWGTSKRVSPQSETNSNGEIRATVQYPDWMKDAYNEFFGETEGQTGSVNGGDVNGNSSEGNPLDGAITIGVLLFTGWLLSK